MGVSDEFLGFLVEQMAGWGEVAVRRMFGGAGLYREGVMFGLVADDVLYLKVDERNRGRFEAAGSGPFVPYPEKVKEVMPSYYEAPAEVVESAGELGRWAQRSWEVAKKSKVNKSKTKRRD